MMNIAAQRIRYILLQSTIIQNLIKNKNKKDGPDSG
jgi:hypothetical protein